MTKKYLKRIINSVLAAVGPHRMPLLRDRLLVLMYHRVLPADHPELPIVQPGMMVTPETLRMHLQVLGEFFTLMHLSRWLADAKAGRPLPARACAITFDDGWADNYRYGFPVLREMEAPATIFLVSDLVGSRSSFWPERLGRALWNGARGLPADLLATSEFRWLENCGGMVPGAPPSRQQIDRIITRAKQYSDDDLHRRMDSMEPLIDGLPAPPRDLLNWDEVAEMTASGWVEVGSHGHTHRRMTPELSDRDMTLEIADSGHHIARKLKVEVPVFCYPNGDRTEAAEAMVRHHYGGACTTQSGWNARSTNPYQLRRIPVHEDVTASRTAFLARLSGVI